MRLILDDSDLIASARKLTISDIGFPHLKTPTQEAVLLIGEATLCRGGGACKGDVVETTILRPSPTVERSPFKALIIMVLDVAPGRKLTLNQLLAQIGLKRGYTTYLDELNARGEVTFARRQEGWEGYEVITLEQ
ncbi:MAG TPA: hypothetical protein VI953_00860 [Candidatus Paceibacterota bacterium]